MAAFATGTKVGPWTLELLLGAGGHSEVWRARHKAGDCRALKILLTIRADGPAFVRFRDEIALNDMLRGREGVLPFTDYYLPPVPSRSDRAWLSMQEATSLRAALGETPPFSTIVTAIAEIATTLADLADEGVAHRDLKPSNLFAISGRYLVGDFGLADYPGKAEITDNDHKLGAWGYLAPEMLNTPADADGGSADVYSLAKTLWVLASGHNFPLPGHQPADQLASRLSSQVADGRAALLDPLVDLATRNDPSERPTMRDFADELQRWLNPPPPSTGPPSIDELIARASDLTGADRARQERAQQVSDRASDTAAAFGREMDQVLAPLQQLSAVTGGTPIEHPGAESSTFSQLLSSGAGGSGSSNTFAFPPPATTWLHTGYGWAIIDDDHLLLFVVLSLNDDNGRHDDLFRTEATVVPDSAEAEHAIRQIADETAEQLPRAVERFVVEGERHAR